MARWQGFSEQLQTASDLLAKLRHDLGRVEANPHDAYAALDFFVTAEHVIDWRWPKDKASRDAERAKEPMSIVSHLASGAKHFQADAPRHRSVSDVRTVPGIFDPNVFDPATFDTGGLVVDLGRGRRVEVAALARDTMARCEQIVASP